MGRQRATHWVYLGHALHRERITRYWIPSMLWSCSGPLTAPLWQKRNWTSDHYYHLLNISQPGSGRVTVWIMTYWASEQVGHQARQRMWNHSPDHRFSIFIWRGSPSLYGVNKTADLLSFTQERKSKGKWARLPLLKINHESQFKKRKKKSFAHCSILIIIHNKVLGPPHNVAPYFKGKVLKEC